MAVGIRMVACSSGSACPSPVRVGPGQMYQPAAMVVSARHNGGLIPGSLMHNSPTCLIPWGRQSIPKTEYFVLSNPGNVGVLWQRASNGQIPQGALEGGYSETGEKLYFGRVMQGSTHFVGKVHPSHGMCYYPYYGQEMSNANYEVLCLKTIPIANLGL